jgi:hypothetical protein
MSNLIQAIQQFNMTSTWNGMPAHVGTGNYNLDLFSKIGSMKNVDDDTITHAFLKAFHEDRRLAFAILLWSRDIIEGAGLRKAFIVSLKELVRTKELSHDEMYTIIKKSLSSGITYWKDFFFLHDTHYEEVIIHAIMEGLIVKDGLLCKWLPRKNNEKVPGLYNKLRDLMKVDNRTLRKFLVANSTTVEQLMSAKKWTDIEYSHVPSIAFKRYKETFEKKDEKRFKAFVQSVLDGKTKINAKAIWPHDVLGKGLITPAIEAQWNSLPNWMKESDYRIMCVTDTSGSMSYEANGLPAIVARALTLYIAERNEGPFKDHAITFSTNPRMMVFKGTLAARVHHYNTYSIVESTNIEKVFMLILNSAKAHNVKESEMPNMILILSDMQFNQRVYARSVGQTVTEMYKSLYQEAGYKLPKVVYWNLNGSAPGQPATKEEKGVALVSGFSPAILKSLLTGKVTNPKEMMLDAVWKERYILI